MLIKCPECGKEVSDMAKICIHCGFPIEECYKPVLNIEFSSKKCPKCNGNLVCIDNNETYEEFCYKCSYIKTINKDDLIKKFVCAECFCEDGILEDKNDCIIIKCSTCEEEYKVFDKQTSVYNRGAGRNTIHAIDLIKQHKRRMDELKAGQNIPKCPKCGCTNIQIVRKNWSWITGFMTNATERVCAKCNYRW